MHVIIHPRAIRVLIFFALIIAISSAALVIHNTFFPSRPASTQSIPEDQAAAVEGATAFYSLDYRESPELWTARVCARSTEAGCQAVRNFYAPAVRAAVEKYRVQSGCSVQAVRMLADHGDRRVWELSVTMNNPWDELGDPTRDVYVEVARAGSQWLMNRILFDQEKQRFAATPAAEGDSQ